jgi:hypothetical protein
LQVREHASLTEPRGREPAREHPDKAIRSAGGGAVRDLQDRDNTKLSSALSDLLSEPALADAGLSPQRHRAKLLGASRVDKHRPRCVQQPITPGERRGAEAPKTETRPA